MHKFNSNLSETAISCFKVNSADGQESIKVSIFQCALMTCGCFIFYLMNDNSELLHVMTKHGKFIVIYTNFSPHSSM